MTRTRRAYSAEERREQILMSLAAHKAKGDDGYITAHQIAADLRMRPSTHLRKLIWSLVQVGAVEYLNYLGVGCVLMCTGYRLAEGAELAPVLPTFKRFMTITHNGKRETVEL